jgi:AcrR family transcriptional regulator
VAEHGYHHGDLARGLTEAAYQQVREQGAETVSVRAACRAAGVSASAAYHHFPDRQALLRAVAGRALGDLAAALRRGLDRCPAGPHDARLVALSQAYVRWALDEPRLFRLALGPVRDYPGQPVTAEPLALLAAELDALVTDGRLHPDNRPGAELALWTAAHGTATLLADGALQPDGGRPGALRLTAIITQTVLRGLTGCAAPQRD